MSCMALYPFAIQKSRSPIKPRTPEIEPSTCTTSRSFDHFNVSITISRSLTPTEMS